MSEQNISKVFRLENIDEARNYLIEEINKNELIGKKHKLVYRVLNVFEYWFILISTITGCVSTFVFAFLVGISIGITSSAIGLKICVVTTGIKNYMSTI